MSYGVQFINNDGVVIIDDTQVGYFISETGTLTPDVTNYNEGSGSQNVCAYYLDNTYELDATEAATATVWNSSTTYAVGALVTRPSEPDLVYSCLQENTNVDPDTAGSFFNTGDNINWVGRFKRTFDIANSPIFSDNTEKETLIFFKLDTVGDEITRMNNSAWYGDLNRPILTNITSLEYAIIKPITILGASASGYGMSVYNTSGDLIYLSNEKLAYIDNMVMNSDINDVSTVSSSSIDWVSVISQSRVQESYYGSGTLFTEVIRRESSTSYKHKVYTYSGPTNSYRDANWPIQLSYLTGIMN